jgi:hypothetical protein
MFRSPLAHFLFPTTQSRSVAATKSCLEQTFFHVGPTACEFHYIEYSRYHRHHIAVVCVRAGSTLGHWILSSSLLVLILYCPLGC